MPAHWLPNRRPPPGNGLFLQDRRYRRVYRVDVPQRTENPADDLYADAASQRPAVYIAGAEVFKVRRYVRVCRLG
jgi:hypothetical protein